MLDFDKNFENGEQLSVSIFGIWEALYLLFLIFLFRKNFGNNVKTPR